MNKPGSGNRRPGSGKTSAKERAAKEFKRLRGVDPFGPFIDLLVSPELMTRVSALGEYLRYRSALPPRLSEFAILITAAHWQQTFEWEIHVPIALKAGVSQQTIDALWRGERPLHLDVDAQALYDVCISLHLTRKLPAKLRRYAESVLSEQQVMDAIAICGYYALLAMVLNSRMEAR